MNYQHSTAPCGDESRHTHGSDQASFHQAWQEAVGASLHLFSSIMFFCVSAKTLTMSGVVWTLGMLLPFGLFPDVCARHICEWQNVSTESAERMFTGRGIASRGLCTCDPDDALPGPLVFRYCMLKLQVIPGTIGAPVRGSR